MTTKETTDAQEAEIWKLIPGFKVYEASNLGRIRSKRFGRKVKILKPYPCYGGYLHVRLGYSAECLKGKNFKVHRLVLMAFVGVPKEDMVCNHKNGIKTDNSLSNLEWCTQSDNFIHALRTGLNKSIGETHYSAKLNAQEVREIRASNLIAQELADKYNVSKSVILRVKRRESWKSIA